MSMWVARQNLDGSLAVEPILCVEVDVMVAQPGHRTLRECLEILIADGERCTGEGSRRPIEKSGHLVGYLTLTSDPR